MEKEKIPLRQRQLQRWPLVKMVEIEKITLKEAPYNTITSRREEVSKKTSQFVWIFWSLKSESSLPNVSP
jgi:hypothetical protein